MCLFFVKQLQTIANKKIRRLETTRNNKSQESNKDNNNAIKREQRQACLNIAEREHFI